jgi:hypothetical protein
MLSTGYTFQILMKVEFSLQIFKKYSISNSIKIFPVEPGCSMRTDVQTDVTDLIVVFRNFANAPKMSHMKPADRPYVSDLLTR